MKKVCFIGHRDFWCDDLKQRLYNEVENQIKKGYKVFTMGTRGKFDALSLSVCRQLRKIYNDIEIEVIITSLNQIKPVLDFDPIFGVEKHIPYEDVKTVMFNIEEEFYKRKIVVSNKKMIDSSSTLICYVDTKRTYGGAIVAFKYAKKKGLNVVNLYNK